MSANRRLGRSRMLRKDLPPTISCEGRGVREIAKGAGELGAMRDYQKQERNFTELANNKIGWPAAGLHWLLSHL
jgi:hypothetical protein